MNNKSALVIDTPTECVKCNQFVFECCHAMKREIERENIVQCTRPKWCPLRPLLDKQKLIVTGKNQIEKKRIIKSKSLEWIKKGYINNPEVAFYCGYNACLDEILGETE